MWERVRFYLASFEQFWKEYILKSEEVLLELWEEEQRGQSVNQEHQQVVYNPPITSAIHFLTLNPVLKHLEWWVKSWQKLANSFSLYK